MKGLSSGPTEGNILSPDFFHVVRASDPNIGIIANFVYLWKPDSHLWFGPTIAITMQVLAHAIIEYIARVTGLSLEKFNFCNI